MAIKSMQEWTEGVITAVFESNAVIARGANALMLRDLITTSSKEEDWQKLSPNEKLVEIDETLKRMARKRQIKLPDGSKFWIPKRIERVSRKGGETWYAPMATVRENKKRIKPSRSSYRYI
jgi:hypothetical protein